MTQDVSLRRQIAWFARIMTIFVAFGGAIGGLAISLPIVAASVVIEVNHHAQNFWMAPVAVLLAGLFGIGVGLPASAITGATYALVGDLPRKRVLIVLIGATTSATWGFCLPSLLSSSSSSDVGMAAIFAGAGAASTLLCLWLIRVWRLEEPN